MQVKEEIFRWDGMFWRNGHYSYIKLPSGVFEVLKTHPPLKWYQKLQNFIINKCGRIAFCRKLNK